MSDLYHKLTLFAKPRMTAYNHLAARDSGSGGRGSAHACEITGKDYAYIGAKKDGTKKISRTGAF